MYVHMWYTANLCNLASGSQAVGSRCLGYGQVVTQVFIDMSCVLGSMTAQSLGSWCRIV